MFAYYSQSRHITDQVLEAYFEGVSVNSRHPGPRRVWKVGSGVRLMTPHNRDPVDPVENSETSIFDDPSVDFGHLACGAPLETIFVSLTAVSQRLPEINMLKMGAIPGKDYLPGQPRPFWACWFLACRNAFDMAWQRRGITHIFHLTHIFNIKCIGFT